jgi:hypothetical protein
MEEPDRIAERKDHVDEKEEGGDSSQADDPRGRLADQPLHALR